MKNILNTATQIFKYAKYSLRHHTFNVSYHIPSLMVASFIPRKGPIGEDKDFKLIKASERLACETFWKELLSNHLINASTAGIALN